ncbi:hypothetical protein XELAEV_18024045mg [Xenopus laevis]|uniref:Uncharacterized protein n=1 Tax=Xenopus laevis TaxID=8355 RepID=A0A974HQ70_XENLA|nr:hypothetical protein XELAEV_18024045mg [Xenopus laevis]
MNKKLGDSTGSDTGPHSDKVFTGKCKSFPESSKCPKVQEHGQKEEPTNPVPDYVRQLHSVLGYEKAEYFLHPPPLDFQISSALQRILDGAQDSPGAQEMWHILRENSQQHLHEDFPEETPEYSESVLKNFAQRPVMQKVSRKRHHLCYIRQALDFYTDMSSLLLANKPILDSSPGQELGSSGYNHQALES